MHYPIALVAFVASINASPLALPRAVNASLTPSTKHQSCTPFYHGQFGMTVGHPDKLRRRRQVDLDSMISWKNPADICLFLAPPSTRLQMVKSSTTHHTIPLATIARVDMATTQEDTAAMAAMASHPFIRFQTVKSRTVATMDTPDQAMDNKDQTMDTNRAMAMDPETRTAIAVIQAVIMEATDIPQSTKSLMVRSRVAIV